MALLACGAAAVLIQPTTARADAAGDLSACETQLKERFAIRHTVVWPGSRIGFSCSSGGPGTCSANWSIRYDKATILSGTGLGDPSKQKIESARTVDRDVSGDASADVAYDADSITFSGHVEKGWFGGGATARVRFEVIFREDTSVATVAVIGRMCAARVFGLGKP